MWILIVKKIRFPVGDIAELRDREHSEWTEYLTCRVERNREGSGERNWER
jgi:hypothetical protein